MPITFKHIENKEYFLSTWKGEVTDEEVFTAYKRYYEGPDWHPSLHEISDVTNADLSALTTDGLLVFSRFAERHFEDHQVASSKTAVVTTKQTSADAARIYEALSPESPETIRVFEDYKSAERWLLE